MGAEKPIRVLFTVCIAATFVSILHAADPLCDGLPAGEVVPIPHEYNCTLYYECLNGDKTLLQCPNGFYFNKDTQSCDFPEASGCKMATDPLCAGLPYEEVYPFPHETNCSLYYECFNGDKTLLECPDGLYYNEKTQACDFPGASGCTNADACDGIDLGYFPHPTDCTKYYECYQGNSYLMNCPNGYWFDSKSKMCVPPEQSDCVELTTPSWTTPHPTCWGVKPNETVLKRYDGDCSKYWRCTGADLTLDSCSPPLLFDEDRQACDFPDLVDCDQNTRTPDPSTPTPPPITSTPSSGEDPRCEGQDIAYLTHPADCHKYIECYHGHSYEMDCPDGLEFSDAVKKCVDPRDSECGKTNPTTHTMPTGWTSDPDCPYPESEGKLMPYPGDCSKYYECAEGKKVEMPCPGGLWFNPLELLCDYPYQANCPYSKYSFLDMIYSYIFRR